MNLPFYKRYQWRILVRNYRCLLTLIWVALLITAIAATVIGYSSEYQAMLAAEEYAEVMAHIRHQPEMGAPGTLASDMHENTFFMSELKKPR